MAINFSVIAGILPQQSNTNIQLYIYSNFNNKSIAAFSTKSWNLRTTGTKFNMNLYQ